MGNVSRQVIVSVVVAMLVFGIGYALFTDAITVSGTAGAYGSMDVQVTSVTAESNGAGTVSTIADDTTKDNQWNISSDNNTVTLTVGNLTYPGASVTYTVSLTNVGTIAAKIDSIVPSTNAEGLIITTTNIAEEDVINGNNGTKTFTVTVTWDEDSSSAFTGEPFDIDYNFSQV